MRAIHRSTVADGRVIGWWEFGSGPRVVLYCHGTPGCGLEAGRLDSLDDVRVIAPDRPGYGDTGRLPGRTVADWAGDAAAVLDACGVGAAAVLGYSGGGPHALAVAHRLPGRVSALGLIAPAAPHHGLRARVEVATAGLRMRVLGWLTAMTPESWPARIPGPAGRAAAAGHRRRAVAFRRGIGGAVDDEIAITARWGFTVGEAARAMGAVPAIVWVGEADRIVHPREGTGIAEAIGARLIRVPGLGHGAALAHGGVVAKLLAAAGG